MASKDDNKFGTFGGVFTPSVLTILGVIMYLRLPWIVGNAGLLLSIGIILAAHVVSVCTGLSISSIATDKSVGAGGAYYIVSRSLGLPIGGTLGLALFVGLSFSISLYIIGFSESLLTVLGVGITPGAIRICGTVTVILLTVITFISTSLAIKAQYVIMTLIAGSLVSIFLGSPSQAPAEPLVGAPADGESLAVLFGIFFPAVTGFTAGVNMSGDLKDSKKSIPTGTMAAVGVAMLIYLGLTVYLAFRVPRSALLNIEEPVLESVALFAPAVTAGVWGATLSSALGSILGAPRILQTVSADGITPRWFAQGYGKTNEPRNALLLAVVIGEAGILIAELDMIARVVSMVFMATYGFLNAAAAIEAWVSPDFRPDFRIPKTISVIGALACVLLMMQMDLAAMAGATVVMAGLYVYLQRRQLQLESGDAWEGVWSALVRAGLHRLSKADRQQRNWRPNILMFRPDDGEERVALRRTAGTLITGNGMLTDIRLRTPRRGAAEGGPNRAASSATSARAQPSRADRADVTSLEGNPVVGVFDRSIVTDDPYETIESFARHHGFSGIEPNTVLLDWDAHVGDSTRFAALIDGMRRLELNTLLFSDATHEPPEGVPPRIDVWWRAENAPALGISLIRFITSSSEHRQSAVRFCTVSRDSSSNDALRSTARRMLEAARVTAEIEIVLDVVEPRSFEYHVADRSADAQLAIVELPPSPIEPSLEELREVTRAVPSVLFVAPSPMFEVKGRGAPASALAGAKSARGVEPSAKQLEIPELILPRSTELSRAAEVFSIRLESALRELYESGLARAAKRNVQLLERATALVDRHFAQLEEGIGTGNPVKRRRTVNRVQSAFLLECGKTIEDFLEQDLVEQCDILEGRLEALLNDRSLVDASGQITVTRNRADFDPAPGDSRAVTRLKRWRRLFARRGKVTYRIDPSTLQRYYLAETLDDVVGNALRSFAATSWNMAVALGRIFNASRTSLTLIHGSAGDDSEAALQTFVQSERAQARDRLGELARLHEGRIEELGARMYQRTRGIAQAYADDLNRVDADRYGRRYRRVPRSRDARNQSLRDAARLFYEYQQALFSRAQVGLKVSAFQHRIAAIVQRAEEAITLDLRNGVLHGYEDLRRQLKAFLEEEREEPTKFKSDLSVRFDPQQAVDGLLREGQRSAQELPEMVRTLSDASIQRLADGDSDDVELVDLPLRRLAQFFLDAELVGPLTELLSKVPSLEERAVGVAEDVIRLIAFHQQEFDPEESSNGFHAHMEPVVSNGLERVEREIGPLEATVPNVRETLDTKLNAVLRGTEVYELTRSAQALGQHIRRQQGQRAVSGAQSLMLRSLARLRQGMVSAVYGRSTGVLMARRLRQSREMPGTLVDRVLGFVGDHTPESSVLEDLPFYYRQLFFGKSTFNETYWVEREVELAQARRGIAQHARGARGLILITGEPDSGKTALARRLTSRALSQRPLFWIPPPDDGSIDPEAFRQRLSEVTNERGSAHDILTALPERSVVVFEDLELWWERGDHGLVVIDELLGLFEAHAGRILFLVELATHPFDMINRFRPLADHALSVISCGPLPAVALKDIVMLRHGSTGVTFELDGTEESDLSEWRLARLFSQHFSYSRGIVGAALTSWITHIERADAGRIVVRTPTRSDWQVLDELRPEWLALLTQLLLHKRLTRERLVRLSRLESRDLDRQVDALRRMGLVQESRQGSLRLNRFLTHILIDRLRERRLIP